jgi:hypothetical protein
MRPSAPWMMPVLASALVGCTLPTLALGASVSFGQSRGDGLGNARASVRSALWVALECSAIGAREREQPKNLAARADDPSLPCASDAACAWERTAARAEEEREP